MKLFLVLDAVGLITFSIIGAQKTLDMGHGYVIAAIMAVITGVFGGVLRDILCNDVPLVFRKELYASVSLAAAGLYFGLIEMQLGLSCDCHCDAVNRLYSENAGYSVKTGSANI